MQVLCPNCHQPMEYIPEDNFYQCTNCNWTLWPDERKVCCPSCHLPMRETNDYYYCSICNIELWPPEEEELNIWRDPDKQLPEPPEELKARCYHQGQIKPGSQSKGRKRKKPKKKQDFSYLYQE